MSTIQVFERMAAYKWLREENGCNEKLVTQMGTEKCKTLFQEVKRVEAVVWLDISRENHILANIYIYIYSGRNTATIRLKVLNSAKELWKNTFWCKNDEWFSSKWMEARRSPGIFQEIDRMFTKIYGATQEEIQQLR